MSLPVTDRELLELAAKANGFVVKGWVNDYLVFFNPATCSAEETWNPLTDDSDALRLAVKLRIEIIYSGNSVRTVVRGSDGKIVDICESLCPRRAIVMAAAVIGRAMP